MKKALDLMDHTYEKKKYGNLQYCVRKLRYHDSLMVNICDEELLGEKIDEKLDININDDFFNELISENEVIKLLHNCSVANLIGKRIVGNTLKLGLAKKESVKIISGTPFLMIYKFEKRY